MARAPVPTARPVSAVRSVIEGSCEPPLDTSPRGPRPHPFRARLHHIKAADQLSESDVGGKMVTCLAIFQS
jgi:hypothetical protein